ncbi:hypothetical protein GE21DRAFT_1252028 [Neurospora crassa]|nr:hypothetical protein B13N20.110 [imported] - Neurospora crassa [Neurospora crassa]KHE87144.1 hypothetical protein GE21DRAFT_1252028 [Neurospora crassa]
MPAYLPSIESEREGCHCAFISHIVNLALLSQRGDLRLSRARKSCDELMIPNRAGVGRRERRTTREALDEITFHHQGNEYVVFYVHWLSTVTSLNARLSFSVIERICSRQATVGSYLLDLEITEVKTVEVMKLDGGWMEAG